MGNAFETVPQSEQDKKDNVRRFRRKKPEDKKKDKDKDEKKKPRIIRVKKDTMKQKRIGELRLKEGGTVIVNRNYLKGR